MATYVMRVLGPAAGPLWDVPEYLAAYNPESHDGRGHAVFTSQLADALTFGSAAMVFECWRQIPRARRRRPDGKPNRPLTAFTVEALTVEAASADSPIRAHSTEEKSQRGR